MSEIPINSNNAKVIAKYIKRLEAELKDKDEALGNIAKWSKSIPTKQYAKEVLAKYKK